MSRSFVSLGIPFVNYRPTALGGTESTGQSPNKPFAVQAAKLCTPTQNPSRVVPLLFNWPNLAGGSLQNANAQGSMGVEVSLPTDISDSLGKIGSLYIDNTGSSIPIYVNFPDTGFCITAPPSTSVWYPVFTNQFRFQVMALNMVVGFIPTTKIFISNKDMAPSIDNEFYNTVPQYIGSTLIQRSNTIGSGFGAPALGDQAKAVISSIGTANAFGNIGMQFPAVSTVVFPISTPTTDYYYITAMEVILSEFSAVITTAAAFLNFIGFFGDQNTATPLVRFNAAIGGAGLTPFAFNIPLINLTGMNLRIPGSSFYGFMGGDVTTPTPPFSVSAGAITSVRYRLVANIVYSQGP